MQNLEEVYAIGMKIKQVLPVLSLVFALCLIGPTATTVAQTDEAAQIQTKYPDADMALREVRTAVYAYTFFKPTVIGSLPETIKDPRLSFVQSCVFCGKKLVFLGDVNAFIGFIGNSDMSSRIINAASIDYDLNHKDNPPLAALGVIEFNENGIVKSDKAKTGLVNFTSTLTFKDNGRGRTIILSNINCWMNRGGDNWISFSVGNAQELNSSSDTTGADVPVIVSMARKGLNGKVTVRIAGKYAFHPMMKDQTTLVFVPAIVAASKPQSHPH